MAIAGFKDKETESINKGEITKKTVKILALELHQKAQIKLAVLGAATDLRDLSDLPSNRLEQLKGDRKGQYSIRINDRYRICFDWVSNNAHNVEIVDYH